MDEHREILYVKDRQIWCDGGDEFGHPRGYYTIPPETNFAICNYCNVKFILLTDTE